MGWVDLVSNGTSGGIIVMQDRRKVELIVYIVRDFLVVCCFEIMDDDCDWAFAGVYCSKLDCNRRFL